MLTDISTVYFDIDNVVRDFDMGVFKYHPDKWETLIEGETVMDYVEARLHLLLECPLTSFGERLREYMDMTGCKVTFLSCQPYTWRDNTDLWLARNFWPSLIDVVYVHRHEAKLPLLLQGRRRWLVDDNPQLAGWGGVITKTMPFNKDVLTDCRVDTFNEFLLMGCR